MAQLFFDTLPNWLTPLVFKRAAALSCTSRGSQRCSSHRSLSPIAIRKVSFLSDAGNRCGSQPTPTFNVHPREDVGQAEQCCPCPLWRHQPAGQAGATTDVTRYLWCLKHKLGMLQWWCPCQCWQHQPLPDLTSQRKHSPTTLVSSPQMAAAKLMEPVALLHWHSFIHIRDVAKIISPARRGWLFFCASTQHMHAGKIIRSHFTARLVTKELAPSN